MMRTSTYLMAVVVALVSGVFLAGCPEPEPDLEGKDSVVTGDTAAKPTSDSMAIPPQDSNVAVEMGDLDVGPEVTWRDGGLDIQPMPGGYTVTLESAVESGLRVMHEKNGTRVNITNSPTTQLEPNTAHRITILNGTTLITAPSAPPSYTESPKTWVYAFNRDPQTPTLRITVILKDDSPIAGPNNGAQ